MNINVIFISLDRAGWAMLVLCLLFIPSLQCLTLNFLLLPLVFSVVNSYFAKFSDVKEVCVSAKFLQSSVSTPIDFRPK